LTLDCPGCQSRLKLDPSKLPAGATTAVCPKCKTRVLLPTAAAAGEITVQCASCSARLKVAVAKLRPAPSKSKCPKCGQSVDLPAAPPAGASPRSGAPPQAGASRSQASQSPVTQMISRPRPQEAPPQQQEAMTRRLDPREIGMVIGAGAGGTGATSSSAAPIPIGDSTDHSVDDLSQLIDEKVNALEDTGPSRAQKPPAASAPAAKPGSPEPAATPAPRSQAAPAASDATARRSAVAKSSSGARQAPEFGAIAAGSAKSSSPAKMLGLLGAISGALVGGALVFLSGSLPEPVRLVPPDAVTQIMGPFLAPLIVVVILSAVGGLLGGVAVPPEGQSAGVSLFRCTVASALLGLLAGVVFTLMAGPFEIMAVAGWTGALLVSGILTGILGLIFRRR